MAGIDFKAVATAITAKELAQAEMTLNRQGRAQCPFHGGHNFNLAFFPDGKCFCHKCHKTADAVGLAAALWGVSQADAARQLNDRYHLGLAPETLSQADVKRIHAQREALVEQQTQEKATQNAEWGKAADELRESEAAMLQFTINDADTPAFDAALKRYGKAREHWANLWASLQKG